MKAIEAWRRKRTVGVVRELIVRQPVRTLTGICGITIACLLMFIQIGLRNALFNRSIAVHNLLKADLVVINKDSSTLATMRPFPVQRMGEIYGDRDIDDITRVRVRSLRWHNQYSENSRNLLALGVDPSKQPLGLVGEPSALESIKGLFNVLFDSNSRREFGPVATLLKSGEKVTSDVSGYRLTVSGLVSIGSSFAFDGYLLASIQTLESLMSDGSQGDAEIGLITIKKDREPEQILKRLKSKIPSDIKILTKNGFIQQEINYWRRNTALGFVFDLGTFFGVIVGSTMIYQVLYTDVSDHLAEYATLRAMGYSMGYLCSIVIKQGLGVSVAGFAPSVVLGVLVYRLIHKATNIAVEMNTEILVVVFVLTTLGSTVAALLVTRRLWSTDPAEIF